MTVNFNHLGVNDEESGFIGILACFISCVPALIVSYFSDKLKKYFKVGMMFINIIYIIHNSKLILIVIFQVTLIVLLILQTASFTWLVLICAQIIPFV